MKSEQWQKIDFLFHAALKREPHQRAAFLDQSCAGDELLREEVEGLIAAHNHAGSFIEGPAFAQATEKKTQNQGETLVGHSFGSYEIVAAIGTGGMGEVY